MVTVYSNISVLYYHTNQKTIFNEVGGVKGTILSIEENWIKVEEKKQIRIINGDMIRDIATAK